MTHSDDRSPSEKTLSDQLPASHAEDRTSSTALPFLPEGDLSEADVRHILRGADSEQRHLLIAELISYAPWEEIWAYLDPDELLAVLPELDLPDSLATAWRRFLSRSQP